MAANDSTTQSWGARAGERAHRVCVVGCWGSNETRGGSELGLPHVGDLPDRVDHGGVKVRLRERGIAYEVKPVRHCAFGPLRAVSSFLGRLEFGDVGVRGLVAVKMRHERVATALDERCVRCSQQRGGGE